MLTEAQRYDYLMQIERLPLALEAALRGLNEEQLDVEVGVGGWSARQLVHHMADVHLHGYACMKAVVVEDRPPLNGRVADSWAQLPDTNLPISLSMWILRGLHGRWTRLLRALPEAAWERTGVGRDGREVTLDELLKTYADHSRSLVERINAWRDRLGW